MPKARTDTLDAVALADRLRPVLLRLARELRREARAEGVSPSQVTLLVAIKYAPGIGLKELAERERVTAPAISRQVDRLVKAGFVERAESKDDRRRVGLTLTEAGRRVLRKVRSRRTVWLAQRLRLLSSSDLAALEAAIEPLARLLDGEERP
jgi:DNA-binding MarR family transcriptional regulator